MFRTLALAVVLMGFFAPAAHASIELVSCTTTSVLDSEYFEEALSVEEYPELTITREGQWRVANIGAALYSEAQGDKIENGISVHSIFTYVITPADQRDSILLTYDIALKRATLSVREHGMRDYRAIAKLTCL